MPPIMEILVCAQEWGVPPWEVYGGASDPPSRWKWFERWKFYTQQRLNVEG